jgi:hypothetical protein
MPCSGDTAPRNLNLGHRWGEWSASGLSRLIPAERAPGTHWIRSRLHLRLMLRPTVNRPICLGIKPSGAYDQISITFRHLRSCSLWASSLTRGRVCLLYMLLVLPAQSFSGPSPLVLETIYYCAKFETSLFVPFYDSQGHGGGIRTRLHTGILRTYLQRLQHCDWLSVSQ